MTGAGTVMAGSGPQGSNDIGIGSNSRTWTGIIGANATDIGEGRNMGSRATGEGIGGRGTLSGGGHGVTYGRDSAAMGMGRSWGEGSSVMGAGSRSGVAGVGISDIVGAAGRAGRAWGRYKA